MIYLAILKQLQLHDELLLEHRSGKYKLEPQVLRMAKFQQCPGQAQNVMQTIWNFKTT